MRNISFALTTRQFLDGIKTVTRRGGWKFLKPGDRLCVVEKSQGLLKGEKIQRIGVIEVVSVRREPLNHITKSDCIAEGFPDWTPEQFIQFYCKHNKCDPDTIVTRIEFKTLMVARKPNSDQFKEYNIKTG